MTTENTVKERIRLYIGHLGISERQFCLSIGVSPAYVGNISRSISQEKMLRISKQYPELNIGWLATGEGAMLRNNQTVGGNNSGIVIGGDFKNNSNNTIDNRQYYSDSPDVLKAQIDLLDERIKEKDAQIKEKDAQIRKLLEIMEKVK